MQTLYLISRQPVCQEPGSHAMRVYCPEKYLSVGGAVHNKVANTLGKHLGLEFAELVSAAIGHPEGVLCNALLICRKPVQAIVISLKAASAISLG